MPKAGDVGPQEKNELHQHLIQQQNEQQRQNLCPIAKRKSRHGHRERDVNRREQPFDGQQVWKVFRQQLGVLADVAVVETLNPEVVQDLKKVGEVEQREIGAVVFAHAVLHPEVNAENEDWLYQEVDKDEEEDVEEEFAFQGRGGLQGLSIVFSAACIFTKRRQKLKSQPLCLFFSTGIPKNKRAFFFKGNLSDFLPTPNHLLHQFPVGITAFGGRAEKNEAEAVLLIKVAFSNLSVNAIIMSDDHRSFCAKHRNPVLVFSSGRKPVRQILDFQIAFLI